ncbi:nematocyst expressed protein 6-like isoform X2 [Glandiceps talaboti]
MSLTDKVIFSSLVFFCVCLLETGVHSQLNSLSMRPWQLNMGKTTKSISLPFNPPFQSPLNTDFSEPLSIIQNLIRPWQLNMGSCPKFFQKQGMCPKRKKGPQMDTRRFLDPAGNGRFHVPIPKRYQSPFYEGDIVMKPQMLAAFKTRSKGRIRRAIARSAKLLWTDGKVPIQIHRDLSEAAKQAIQLALDHWENTTCIRFHKKQPEDKDYIHFVSDYGCWSYVGRQRGKQKISVGFGCEHMGTVAHEIGHALGFWHEQSRLDRDNFIKIHEENVIPGAEENFGLLSKKESKSRNFAYDYNSIMHYGANYFSKNGRATIEVTKRGKKVHVDMGQRDALSNLDVAQARDLYRCNTPPEANAVCVESETGDGREYRGTLDYTVEGITCQKWTLQWPHEHKFFYNDTIKDERRGVGDHNYCRNPNGRRSKPWCWTTRKDIKWQYCAVTLCPKGEY